MLSFLRIIKFSIQDIVRNISLSFMTVLILVLMLLSINTLLVVRVLTSEAITGIENELDVSIHFSTEATDEEIQEIKDYVNSFPEVKESIFYTSEEVLEQFRKAYKDNSQIVSSLDELNENPLGPSLVVKTQKAKDYENIITALDIPEYESVIQSKTFADTQEAIGRIHVITQQVERFTMFLTSLFAIIAFIIIFNTVRVAIYTQRIEIGIKKLVGATNWFVRGPYVIESFIFTFVSVVVAGVTIYFALGFLDPYISIIFQKDGILTNYYSSHILELAGFQALAVLLLTIITSLLAIRRYLRI